MATGSVAAYGSDSPDGFEEKEYLPGMDIWVNQTTAPSQLAPSQNGIVIDQSWELQRYVLLPNSVDLSTWIIYDQDAIFVVGGFGGSAIAKDRGMISVSATGEEKTETGLTGFTGRATDGVTKVDANERVSNIDATIIDATYDHFATKSTRTACGPGCKVARFRWWRPIIAPLPPSRNAPGSASWSS